MRKIDLKLQTKLVIGSQILIGLLKAIDVIELPLNPHEKLSGKVIDLRKKIYHLETKLRAD